MSTSETVEFVSGPCPCGQGKIIKNVTTQDNPWSSADISHHIDCSVCAGHWRVEHGRLVDRSTEAAFRAAQAVERPKSDALHAIASQLADGYFERFAAKTKKAEHAEMARLGIYKGSYRNFLEARKGKSAGEVCYALGNMEWLRSLAAENGLSSEFALALSEYEEAHKRSMDAYAEIKQRPIPDSRSILS